MKKVLIGVLSAITCFGLAGCQGGKKLSKEEAQTEIRQIAESINKNKNKLSKIKANASFKTAISYNNLKAKTGLGNLSVDLGSFSGSVKFDGSLDVDVNTTDKIAKFSSKIDASANADIDSAYILAYLGEEGSEKKYNFSANGKIDGYCVGTEEIYNFETWTMVDYYTNLYANYDFNINKELANTLYIDETNFKGSKNLLSYEYLFEMFSDDYVIFEDLDEDFSIIKNWDIFTMKGNTLTIDCSDLNAFDIDDVEELEGDKGGLKISKLSLTLNDDKLITGFDIKGSVKNETDFSKEKSYPYSGGKNSNEASFELNIDFEYGEQPKLEVPKNLTDLEEEDMEDFFDMDLFEYEELIESIQDRKNGVDTKAKAAAKSGDALVSTLKMISMEATAQTTGDVTVTADFGSTLTNVPKLKVLDGTTDKTSTWGFSDYDALVEGLSATGSLTLVYNLQNGTFSYSTSSLNIDGYNITVDSYGKCQASK